MINDVVDIVKIISVSVSVLFFFVLVIGFAKSMVRYFAEGKYFSAGWSAVCMILSWLLFDLSVGWLLGVSSL